MLYRRIWVKSGVVEVLDEREASLMDIVLQKIQFYYKHLYGTRPCYQYPLNLSRLMKLCNRSGSAVRAALRYLANTIPVGEDGLPPVTYDRINATKNKSHRPFRIFLRKKYD